MKLDELMIKQKNESLYFLYLHHIYIGKLIFQKNSIQIKMEDEKYSFYKNSFAKLFIHEQFQKKQSLTLHYENQIFNEENFYFMRKYKTLLFDIDDTILNFHKAERKALCLALKKLNVEVNEEILNRYHEINIKYWKMVEEKIITRDDCLIQRFEEFLPIYSITMKAKDFEDLYRHYLNQQAYVIKNARLVLTNLQKNYRIYAITNGVKQTQDYRMKKAKMQSFFEKSFVSEAIGYHKPSLEYLQYVKVNIENFQPQTTLIIGDSLSSDIQLGINGHMDTCWFNLNRKRNTTSIQPTYEIHSLLELLYR